MDRFSQLPDDLLIKILSFLLTKEAVATSNLAKRWLSLWTLVPILNFEDRWEHNEDTNEYHLKVLPSHLVSGTLLLHKSPVIESFHVSKAAECSASEIDLWVRIAADRFLRDLKISFVDDVHCLIRLPSRLFRCETLETLELQQVVLLEVPSRFSLRSLKKLRLRSVKYADEKSFVRLISNCPVLEDLVVVTFSNDNVATFAINVPSLGSLTVTTHLQESRTDAHLFVIHPHSLKQLNIVDYFGEVKLIGKFTKLVEASLHSACHNAKLLESLTFVKRLYLCLDEEAKYPGGTVLSQLVYLELYSCEDNWTNMLVNLLQHSPKLQVLELVLNHWRTVDSNICWIQPSCVPECLLHHVKTFEWDGYQGTQVEKEVAIYILKNAKGLVTATIYPMQEFYLERRHQIFEELEIASRGSRACELRMG